MGHGGFLRKFGMDLSWVIWKDAWLAGFDGTPAGRSGRMVSWNFLTGTRLGDPEEILVGILDGPRLGES